MTILTLDMPAVTVAPEDLLQMPDAVNYELVDGRLVERNTGMESSRIAAGIIVLIGIYLKANRLGELFGADASYQCFPGTPNKVRRPDVSFIRMERLPGGRTPKGHSPIRPDLAVEVISPGDIAEDVEDKVAEYRAAGIALIWVVYPSQRIVRIHRPASSPAGTETALREPDTITGEEVLPGFSCPIRSFFDPE